MHDQDTTASPMAFKATCGERWVGKDWNGTMDALEKLDTLKTLVLNADNRPLHVAGWREAISAVIRMSAYPVTFHSEAARSPNGTYPIPSVMIRERYVRVDRPAAYTRRNVFLAYAECGPNGRATWRCALCGRQADEADLTFDHIVPRSKGGSSQWDNCCLAHSACNQRKGDRTLAEAGIRSLHVAMRRPTDHEVNQARLRFAIGGRLPADWAEFISDLYWDSTLEA